MQCAPKLRKNIILCKNLQMCHQDRTSKGTIFEFNTWLGIQTLYLEIKSPKLATLFGSVRGGTHLILMYFVHFWGKIQSNKIHINLSNIWHGSCSSLKTCVFELYFTIGIPIWYHSFSYLREALTTLWSNQN